MLRWRTDSRRAVRRGTPLAAALCAFACAFAGQAIAQEPVPAELPAEPLEIAPPPQDQAEALRYLRSIVRTAARENRGRQLKQIARTGTLQIELPESIVRGELRFKIALLPSKGRAIRLARVGARAPIGARPLDELRLGKRARRRLAKLWVAAIEITATFTPDGGTTEHARAVFMASRR